MLLGARRISAKDKIVRTVPEAELLDALAKYNAEQAPPAWPSQASVPINIDKDLSQPDAAYDEYIYWSN